MGPVISRTRIRAWAPQTPERSLASALARPCRRATSCSPADRHELDADGGEHDGVRAVRQEPGDQMAARDPIVTERGHRGKNKNRADDARTEGGTRRRAPAAARARREMRTVASSSGPVWTPGATACR